MGQSSQAIGRSCGGFTTKIHAKADCCGNLIGFDLMGSETSDGRHLETLMNIGPDIAPRTIVADKSYDSLIKFVQIA